MARKKGVVKELSNYGEKHPVVTLALAGTLGYYLYDTMIPAAGYCSGYRHFLAAA